MTAIPYNDGQLTAIELAQTWYRKAVDRIIGTKKYFFLSGYAGTGKTTVARAITDLCCRPSEVVYIAPTGKAASRLRAKGCHGATTLHKFLYHFTGTDSSGRPEFIPREALETCPRLIVCDECSMLGKRDVENLLSLGIPVLFLGDLGQVPPVSDEPYFTDANCDFKLEKIERNKGNIVRASFFIRTGGRLPVREYDDVKVRIGFPTGREIKDHIDEDGVILCAYNSTRQHYNFKARALLGMAGDLMPRVGEKLVCTFNQHSYGIMNGEQFILKGLKEIPADQLQPGEEAEWVKIAVLKSLTNLRDCEAKINLGCFIFPDEDDRFHAMRNHGGFDFGYALTVHKSQGSEWTRVMVIEEFLRSVPYHQLMYTAVTRAIEHLTVYRKD